jgi:hypothetical protein
LQRLTIFSIKAVFFSGEASLMSWVFEILKMRAQDSRHDLSARGKSGSDVVREPFPKPLTAFSLDRSEFVRTLPALQFVADAECFAPADTAP